MSFTLNRNIGHRGELRLSRRLSLPTPPHMSSVLGSGGDTNPFEGAASVGDLFHSSSSTDASTAPSTAHPTTNPHPALNQAPARNVSTILRQPSVEFKLGCLAISPVD